MFPLQILLISDIPEDDRWVEQSLYQEFPNVQIIRASEPACFLQAVSTGAFQIVIARNHLARDDRFTVLETVKNENPRCQIILLAEADDAIPGLIETNTSKGEDYILRIPAPSTALLSAVRGAFTRYQQHENTDETAPLQDLFDLLPFGKYRITPEGKILATNPSLINLLGYPDQKTLHAINFWELFAVAQERTRLEVSFKKKKLIHNFEMRLYRHDGSMIWAQLNVRSGEDPEAGTRFLEGTLEDITARKSTSQALRESEHFIQTVLSNVQEGIIFYDRELRYRVWNEYMEKMSGLQADHLLGSPVGNIYSTWDEPGMVEVLNRTLNGETVFRQDAPFHNPQTGISGSYEAVYTPLVTAGGEIAGVLAFIRDNTGDKNNQMEYDRLLVIGQKQRQLTEMLGRIILAMSVLPGLPALLELICREAATFLEMDSAQIWLLQEDALAGAASYGLQEKTITGLYVSTLNPGHLGVQVLQTKKPIFINDLLEDSHIIHSGLSGIFQVRSIVAVPLLIATQALGVLLLVDTRHPHDLKADTLETILYLGSQAAVAVENARLFETLQQANKNLVQAYDATLTGWVRALELRDRETEGHTQRVVAMTLKLASAFGMSEEVLAHVYRGALLHDIGKMGIPDSVLRKPAPLNEDEWKIMRQHPVFAYEMLKPIDYLNFALDIPYCHHEKWDGSGYPRGLKGEEIPILARMFAVVDVWDALSFDRPYRKAWPQEQVLEYLRSEVGKHFDPQVVAKFLEILDPSKTENGSKLVTAQA
jgi:PAS domain S-box-containing protein